MSDIPSAQQLRHIIGTFLRYKGNRRNTVQIAFYGGNFLGLPPHVIQTLLNGAEEFIRLKQADSIRFSTRPDTITPEQLDRLRGFSVRTIEIGVQSMNDNVLAISRRGHTAQDTINAVRYLKENRYDVGIQMMVGLPGDNQAITLETGRHIIRLAPDFVRIYPTLVIENSVLAQWYHMGRYTPLTLEQAVGQTKELYCLFTENNIPVIRMGLQTSDDFEKESVLAGPFHPAFAHLVHSEIFLDKILNKLKISETDEYDNTSLLIKVHPRNISTVRGLKNKNIEYLKTRFHFRNIEVLSDMLLSESDVKARLT
jgi:histone acetyltransferase (RNA polymerase elongator complex component)